jgi:hypothetical protein
MGNTRSSFSLEYAVSTCWKRDDGSGREGFTGSSSTFTKEFSIESHGMEIGKYKINWGRAKIEIRLGETQEYRVTVPNEKECRIEVSGATDDTDAEISWMLIKATRGKLNVDVTQTHPTTLIVKCS